MRARPRSGNNYWHIICTHCGIGIGRDTREEAERDWNALDRTDYKALAQTLTTAAKQFENSIWLDLHMRAELSSLQVGALTVLRQTIDDGKAAGLLP
jgi:hypothetical protein